MIEISRLKDLNAVKLFLGFRIGAVSRRDFAVFPVQGQRGLRRLKRYFGDKMSVGAQMVVVLKAFVERCVSLVLGHPFEFSWLDVSQADVFHRILSSWWEPARSHARWIVHPIVVAHRKNRQQRRTILFRETPAGNWGTFRLSPIFLPIFLIFPGYLPRFRRPPRLRRYSRKLAWAVQ